MQSHEFKWANQALSIRHEHDLSGIATEFAVITSQMAADGLIATRVNQHPVCLIYIDRMLHISMSLRINPYTYEQALEHCQKTVKNTHRPY